MTKQSFCVFLMSACFFCSSLGCNGSQPVISPGDTVAVCAETVDAGGRTITVAVGDDNIDGLNILVPAGAFMNTQTITVSYRPIKSHSLPGNALILTPLVNIDTDGVRAADYVTVTLPAKVPENYFAMAFYYDAEGNRLEGMNVSSQPDGGVAFLARHFSPFVAVAVPSDRLQATIPTGFTPGVDDWQFKNSGSWIAPGGHCAGQSIMALYYYTEKKLAERAPSLYGRYDNDGNIYHPTPTLPHDDVQAYRLCSVAQTELSDNVRADSSTWYDAKPSDLETFNAFSEAMLISGEPQFVTIQRTNAKGKKEAHAMVVYKESRRLNAQNKEEGVLNVSDPNYPDQEREIIYNFATGSFIPYNSGPNADELGLQYPEIYFKEKRDLFDPAFDGRMLWDAFERGTVGEDLFPEFTIYLCKRYADYTQERLGIVTDSFEFKGSQYDEYTFEVVGDGFKTAWDGYQEDGTKYTYKLTEGLNRVGIHVRGEKTYTNSDGEQQTANTWVGFRWVNITLNPGQGEDTGCSCEIVSPASGALVARRDKTQWRATVTCNGKDVTAELLEGSNWVRFEIMSCTGEWRRMQPFSLDIQDGAVGFEGETGLSSNEECPDEFDSQVRFSFGIYGYSDDGGQTTGECTSDIRVRFR